MSERIETLVLRDMSSGRLHEAIRVNGGQPMVNDACNVIGDREYMSDFPPNFKDSDLCQRCFGDRKAK